MTLIDPDAKYSFIEFENRVGEILKKSLPFGVLSRVPVFRADTDEDWLHANEIDHLLHYHVRGIDHLVLVECKNNSITSSLTDFDGPAPTGNEKWLVHYPSQQDQEVDPEPTDVREQLRHQARALLQYLGIGFGKNPVIECWVVHRRKDCEILQLDQSASNGPVFRAFNIQQLEEQLPKITCGERPLTINRSHFLAPVARAIPKPNHPHPPILDALESVQKTHRQIDRELFHRFNNWFPKKHELWAIKGTAGSGKSVLLAYTLAALSTNVRIEPDGNGSYTLSSLNDDGFLPRGIVAFAERRIQVFSRSEFQLKLLERYYQYFIEKISAIRNRNPETCEIEFSVWQSKPIDARSNVLAIDEAHDLSIEDQEFVKNWYEGKSPNTRHITVAIDRHQQLRNSKKSRIIEGLNFSSLTNEMTRNYRSPFTIYAAAISLLFRWQATTGPHVKPETKEVNKFKRSYSTFKNGINLTVIDRPKKCEIYLRNDSHPGNFWGRTIDIYRNSSDLSDMLLRERLTPNEVKWLRFERFKSSDSERNLIETFEFFDIPSEGADEFIDLNIKGDEFPIIVIEGLPKSIDDIDNPEAMWHARRQLYTCASRATAFLFFVLPQTQENSRVRAEVMRIISNLEKPEKRSAKETGLRWSMKFAWSDETIGVSDFEDAVVAEIEREG